MTTYRADLAWLPPGRLARNVAFVVSDGRFTDVVEGTAPGGGDRLGGLVLPGLANAHSHAFHRALRGRTQGATGGRGSFWTWRDRMYAVAEALDPDSYVALARASYGEMVLAGITAVGEFHYLHHGPAGARYGDPNEMGHAVVRAAREAGLRITLLDTCYLSAGPGRPLEGVQQRFGDGNAATWADRVEALHSAYAGAPGVVVGAAAHSVRAVPADQLGTIAVWAGRHGAPLHAHVSEQQRENDECLAAYGVTPTRLLHEHGLLGTRSSAVHATHLTNDDVGLLGGSGTGVCMCPTTERDLADGVGPALRLRAAGSPVTLGSDSHAVVDLFEEARAVELDERLVAQTRGHWSGADLLDAATRAGHASLGSPDAGLLAPGAVADLVAVRLDSVRTAGGRLEDAVDRVVFGAGAADVTDVVVGGRRVVEGGEHLLLGDVGGLIGDAVAALG
ncbi:MAG TPA: formimidoylglutamate deiminase [Actinomycetes bacterium]|nr:formimidoylglutamate deiminase [Actinomycetes bacterium]